MKKAASQVGKGLGWVFTTGGGVAFSLTLALISFVNLLLSFLITAFTTWSFGVVFGSLMLALLPVLIASASPMFVGWLFFRQSKQLGQQAIADRFHLLLKRQKGRISLLEFAAAADLEPSLARQYLDRWAVECDANFDVTEAGDIYYVFAQPPQSLPGGTAPFTPFSTQRQKHYQA
jgi:hypothetical protein